MDTSSPPPREASPAPPSPFRDARLPRSPRRPRGFWATLSGTFTTVLLAEMGDKTQVATLLIAAESQSPVIVFAGAALALLGTTLIGVLLGVWLSRRIAQQTLDLAAAIVLLALAILLLWDVVQI